MSTFQVYFILQLDSIAMTAWFVAFCIALIQGLRILLPRIGQAIGFEAKDWEDRVKNSPPWKSMFWPVFAFAIVSAFIPDTKTVAASIIAPRIVNSAAIQKDIPELYDMALAKLKIALSPASKPEVEKAK